MSGPFYVTKRPTGVDSVTFWVGNHYEEPGTLSDGVLSFTKSDMGRAVFREGNENLPKLVDVFDLVSIDGDLLPTEVVTRGWIQRYSDQTWTLMTIMEVVEEEGDTEVHALARVATSEVVEATAEESEIRFVFPEMRIASLPGMPRSAPGILSGSVLTLKLSDPMTGSEVPWVFHRRQ